MTWIREVEIKNFRGIREGTLTDLKGINILVGRNNTGKSTILEAIYTGLLGADPDILGAGAIDFVVKRRTWIGLESGLLLINIDAEESVISIKFNDDSVLQTSISIEAPRVPELEILRERGLDISNLGALKIVRKGRLSDEQIFYFDKDGKITVSVSEEGEGNIPPAVFIDWNRVYSFNSPEKTYKVLLKRSGYEAKETILKILGVKFSEIKSIELFPVGDHIVLHIVYIDRALPYYVLGDGVKSMLMYIMILNAAENAILLVEEPELHLHSSLMDLVCEALIRTFKERGNQVILSTHSLEFVDKMLEHVEKHGIGEELRIYRTMLENGVLKTVAYSFEEAKAYRRDLEYDLRG